MKLRRSRASGMVAADCCNPSACPSSFSKRCSRAAARPMLSTFASERVVLAVIAIILLVRIMLSRLVWMQRRAECVSSRVTHVNAIAGGRDTDGGECDFYLPIAARRPPVFRICAWRQVLLWAHGAAQDGLVVNVGQGQFQQRISLRVARPIDDGR